MDGITNSFYPSNSSDPVCNIIIANFSHLPIKIPANTPLASLTSDPRLDAKPLSACLSISTTKPHIVDTAHIEQLNLSHIPPQFKSNYLSLLRSYADAFSKNDLDIGHCKSLPHQVRLTDPNKITSMNQYRLPHHLKEVAIDYVEQLLEYCCKSYRPSLRGERQRNLKGSCHRLCRTIVSCRSCT